MNSRAAPLAAAGFGLSALLWLLLALARLIPVAAPAAGDLPHFTLISVLTGLGAGILARERDPAREELLSGLLRLLALAAFYAGVSRLLPDFDDQAGGILPVALGLAGVAIGFALNALALLPLGRALRDGLDALPPAAVGRLAGATTLANLALFAIVGSASSPLTRLLPAAVFFLLWAGIEGLPRRGLLLAAGLWLAISLLVLAAGVPAIWSLRHLRPAPIDSPRAQRLLPKEMTEPAAKLKQDSEVWTGLIIDRGFFEFAADFNPTDLALGEAKWPGRMQALTAMSEFIRLPFRLRPPGRTLVLASGLGNEVAAALREGVPRVDAVELDPELLRLGRLHPERPYQSPSVSVRNLDPRRFLLAPGHPYDLIVFAPLDAYPLLQRPTGIARPAPLYTRETIAAAVGRLSADGVIAVMVAAPQGYVGKRLFQTLRNLTGSAAAWTWINPAWDQRGVVIAAGPGLRRYRPYPGPGMTDRTAEMEPGRQLHPATRDWPYLFLLSPGTALIFILPLLYLGGAGTAIVIFTRTSKSTSPRRLGAGAASLLLAVASAHLLDGCLGDGSLPRLAIAAILALPLALGFQFSASRPAALPVLAALLALAGVQFVLMRFELALPGSWLPFIGCAAAGLTAGALGIFLRSLFAATLPAAAAGSLALGLAAGGIVAYLTLALGFAALNPAAAALLATACLLGERRWP